MPQKKITESQKELVRSLYSKLSNGYKVARMLGMAKSTVYKIIPVKSPRPRWTEEEKSELAALCFEGLSRGEIAKKLGKSEMAVRVAICRHRKKARSDTKLVGAAYLLGIAIKAGLTPDKAIRAIRKSDALNRLKEEMMQYDLQL